MLVMSFIESIKERAKQNKKTIVLPESMDSRVMDAASKLLSENISNIIRLSIYIIYRPRIN